MSNPNRIAATASCLVLLTCLPALSSEITATSTIRDVTVYPDGAEITRSGAEMLPAGASTLIFKELPATVDPASVRLSGESSASLSISSAEIRMTPVETPAQDSSFAEKIKALTRKLDPLKSKLDGLTTEINMAQRFAQNSPVAPTPPGSSSGLSVKDWSAAFAIINDTIAHATLEKRETETQISEINAQISDLQSAAIPSRPHKGGANLQATFSIETETAAPAKIILSYRVHNASWRPVYDARLDTKKGSLELVQRAEIKQTTGENWNDVAISVSTATSNGHTSAVSLEPLFVNIIDPLARERSDENSNSSGISLAQQNNDAAIAAQSKAPSAPVQATPAREATAAITFGNFTASFDIAGKTSVAGDGSTRSLRLESHTSTPELSVRIVPSVDPTGYLEAHLVNKTNAPLLPGNVNLFRDGAFSGKTAIPAVAASDSYNLGFGADNSVKVTREPISLLKSNAAWNKWSTSDVSDIKTTVKNLHSIPMAIVVNDRIPVARNDDIKVDLLSDTTPLSTKDFDGKVGVYAWNFNLAPGASKDIRLAYKISWPAGKNITIPR